MKAAVIVNGISLFKSRLYHELLPSLQRVIPCDVFETQSRNDAITLGAKSVAKRYDVVFAAGGDGTVHQVVNGMLRDYEPPTKLPVLGILPLGSGNDFARSIGDEGSTARILTALTEKRFRTIDVGEVTYQPSPAGDKPAGHRYFVNVADVGMGPEVVTRVTSSGRAFGSAISYYQAIISTFFTYKPVMLHARAEDWQWDSPMRTFAIANGRYYGNGLCVAPEALLDDAQFNVFACGDVSVLDFIMQSLPLKQGKFVKQPKVAYRKTKQVHLSSDGPVRIEADGEILGWLPASVRLSSAKIETLDLRYS